MEERLVDIDIPKTQCREILKILCDATTFFDAIDPEILARECKAQGYGLRHTCHTMITHLGPRVLNVSGHFARITKSCGRSILAGCQNSLSLWRAYTNDAVDGIRNIDFEVIIEPGKDPERHGEPQGLLVKQHVDDITIILWSINQAKLGSISATAALA